MITSILLKNFKCIPNIPFKLNKVNIFSGYNGRGKSSILQSIMMLSQSIKKNNLNSLEKIHLNGDLINLGDFDEILNNDHLDKFEINLGLQSNDIEHNISFGYKLSDIDIKVGEICKCIIDNDDFFDSVGSNDINVNNDNKILAKLLPSYINSILGSNNIHYVSANRGGPVKFVEKMEIPEVHKVGRNGNFTINTLSTYKEKVSSKMNISNNDEHEYDLVTATTKWIEFIMNGGNVNVEDYAKNENKRSSTLSLQFGFENNNSSRKFESYNVGFGYSYILSIIVSALIAKEGNILIIENPEAHLHPKAQLNLSYLLAKLTGNGVQVFIETHSEHIVNGFRIAALKDDFSLNNNDLNIFFFNYDFSITQLKIEKNGKIKNWPEGFFDQYQHELAEILKLGRNNYDS